MALQLKFVRQARHEMASLNRGLSPKLPRKPKVLLLGSYPGVKSLAAQQYYAHPQNNFWRLIEALFGIPVALPYDARIKALKATHLGIWDVCRSAKRVGSLDSKIGVKDVVPNEFAKLLKKHPGISRICFNGQTAAKLYGRLVLPELDARLRSIALVPLPSSSPANTRSTFKAKLAAWRDGIILRGA